MFRAEVQEILGESTQLMEAVSAFMDNPYFQKFWTSKKFQDGMEILIKALSAGSPAVILVDPKVMNTFMNALVGLTILCWEDQPLDQR